MLNQCLKSNTALILGVLLMAVALMTSACAPATTPEPVTGATWQWSSWEETLPVSLSVVPQPENYTLRLQPDGTLVVKADCNMANGTYTLGGNALILEVGPATMAYCGDESLDQQFLQLLAKVDSFTLENGQLILTLDGGAGRMVFIAA